MPPDRWLAITVHLPPGWRSTGLAEETPERTQGVLGRRSGSRGVGSGGELDGESPSEVAHELIPELLMELGGRGVEEKDGSFTTYLLPPEELEAFLAEAEASVKEVGGAGTSFQWHWQAQEDWESFWRRGLGPRRISDRILVAPTWEIPEVQEGEILIVLDPGMAFGTAEHATTRGCLRLLDSRVGEGDLIADVGSGSGILSIAAALMGAGGVLALEVDPLACEAALENVDANGVGDRVQILAEEVGGGDPLPQAPFHGIVANVQRTILLPLLPAFRKSLVEGGWVILSGILEEELAEVVGAASATGLTLEEGDQEGEWWSGAFRLTEPSD